MSNPPGHAAYEDIARRGEEIYQRDVRRRVEAEHQGRVVAIDVNTGAYAVGETAVEAAERLRGDHVNAEVWLVRVGELALHRIGGGRSEN